VGPANRSSLVQFGLQEQRDTSVSIVSLRFAKRATRPREPEGFRINHRGTMDTERRSCGLEFNHTPSPAVCKKPIDKPVRGTTQHRPATLPCHAPSHLSSSASSPPTPRRAKRQTPRAYGDRIRRFPQRIDSAAGHPPLLLRQTPSDPSRRVRPRESAVQLATPTPPVGDPTLSNLDRTLRAIDRTLRRTKSKQALEGRDNGCTRPCSPFDRPPLFPSASPAGSLWAAVCPGLPEQFAGLSPLHSDSGSLRLKAQ